MINLILSLFILFGVSIASELPCILSVGEGEAVIGDNFQTAETEAIQMAKWNAIEKALGIKTKTKTVVENYRLLDEVVIKEIKGFITDVQIISEQKTDKTVKLKIKGCVYPEKAQKLLSLLTKNTSISILFFPEDINKVEFNTLNTVVIKFLTEQGFNVVEIKNNLVYSEKDFTHLKKIALQNLSGAMVLGKIRIIPVTLKGQYIGYGLHSPFYVLKAVAEYRLLVKDKKDFKVLFSDIVSAQGMGANLDIAKHKALEKLGVKLSNDLLQKLNDYLQFRENKLTLVVENVYSFKKNFEIKAQLQKLPWVKSVKDIDFGKFEVIYYENPVYFAYSLQNSLGYKIKKYSPTLIVVEKNEKDF